MKALVTGHLGFIGKRLFAKLSDDGHDVLGWDTAYHPSYVVPRPKTPTIDKNWDAGLGECWDEYSYESLNEYLVDGYFDVIYHLGAISGLEACASNPERAALYNIASTASWLAYANETGARVVFTSSAAVNAPRLHQSIYGATKQSCEQFIQVSVVNHQSPFTVLRLSNVYGPGSFDKTSVVATMIKSALSEGRVVIHGDGQQRRDFIHVDDVVECLIAAPDQGVFSVRSGKPTSIFTLATWISQITGAKLDYDSKKGGGGSSNIDTASELHPKGGNRLLAEGIIETVDYFREYY